MSTNPVKTKVICTIGPASNSRKMLEKLMLRGMDVARLNFSHGSKEGQLRVIKYLRSLSRKHRLMPGILGDLQGFKIRTGRLRRGRFVNLKPGNRFTLTTEEIEGDGQKMSVSFKNFPGRLKIGKAIYLRDGLIELQVEEITKDEIVCRVVHGGRLKGRDGVNVPGLVVREDGLTEKDSADIRFAIENDIDFLAVSFVRGAGDLKRVAGQVEAGCSSCRLIAKIETKEAVENINEILEHCHGIMIARGDLGVELLPEKVPVIQKELIALCNEKRKLVITATQMLESMTEHSRPTRAEASDVANAVFDGTDALLLSGETAAGRYPVESLVIMKRIAKEAEIALERTQKLPFEKKYELKYEYPDAICHSASYAADQLKARAIVVLTKTGYTGFLISKYHPRVPIIGISQHRETARNLSFYRGVIPVLGKKVSTLRDIKKMVDGILTAGNHAKAGDTVIIISGTPEKNREMTDRLSNLLMIHKVE